LVKGLPSPFSLSAMKINSAFMNDLDIVAVRIEHPCRIVARIVFGPRLRGFLALAAGGHRRFVEGIHLGMVFRYKPNMHRLGIGLPFLEPEKSSFAVTKALQIGVSLVAFVVCKVRDPKRLQGLRVKSDRTLEITDRENDVVYHIFALDRVPLTITYRAALIIAEKGVRCSGF
jgi:hypothetical protein